MSLDKIYSFAGKGLSNQSDGSYYNYVDNFQGAPLILGTGAATTLWFTAAKGGNDDEGELAKFTLANNRLTVLGLNFGGASEVPPAGSGNFVNDPARPDGRPVYDNGDGTKNYLYFTTLAGGLTGNSTGGGTLVRYDMDANTYQKLWDAPAAAAGGLRQPRGTVAIVDRGVDGKDVYFSASGSGGGNNTTAGGILRYNTKTNTTSVVVDLEGAPGGAMPYDGFVRVGDRLYFTTFGGGTGPATGSGTLSGIDISNPAAPTYQVLGVMPGTMTSGLGSSERLPAGTPVYDSVGKALYFIAVGTNLYPGAIMKFSLETSGLTTAFTFTPGDATNQNGPNSTGRGAGYDAPWLYNGYLYYLSRTGGLNNLGTVSRYNLQFGTNEVLYHLTTSIGGEPNGGLSFSDFDFNTDGTPDPSLYFVTTGTNTSDGLGSIVRLSLPAPEPGSVVLCLFGASFALISRRRKVSRC